ncbi:hypothetical protein JK628_11690 [Shewanella sp. KX20019]|uniref:dipeptidyl-peptidase 3 family protein n=1 Tax=Shewanella sp. KX20019 TaxID=2803864 RepID=UPI001928F765|nr:hypothetical protein [Shewanella sp. KX20019]QQX78279.1 hypothetical protein JK628_11690 [Shewanella sp. KX20019]
MKLSLITLALAVAISGCSQTEQTLAANDTTSFKTVNSAVKGENQSATYQAMLDQLVDIDMQADLTSLSPTDTLVLRKIIEVADILDGIYFKQTFENNAAVRQQILASTDINKSKLLSLFELHYGAWDTLNGDKPFFGSTARPDGAGVYPVDLTKSEFNQWIAAHPEDEKSFKSGYTVIVRDKEQLKAIPYSIYYKEELTDAAKLMREAAELTKDQTLKIFLSKRADSFLNDKYRDSEMAWMDLNGSLEIAIGPYETYTDKLFGYKTFFEAFITVRNPEDSAKLDIYKKYLTAMESNLPIPDEHKNVNRAS